ncbi:hypothetical protein PATY110618_11390 [Paenibacillus typhae]|uniref:Uncharacterized protein n=1 Tax=Paenibacillus typhae TaxID=1174501 RepID=A0A1G9HUB7_9BACL|nr:hypothetical protein SAMN05216192_1852 [Paenibacillus typhae]
MTRGYGFSKGGNNLDYATNALSQFLEPELGNSLEENGEKVRAITRSLPTALHMDRAWL